MTDYIVVFVTTPEEEAADLAKTLVAEKLVACVNIVPGLRSLYWWEAQVEDEPEALCIMKTRSELFERLQERVRELHPYEVEEIVALPILAGNPPYLDWIKQNTQL